MATAAPTRPSGPVLSIPHYRSASPTRVKLASARSPGKSVSVSSPSAKSRRRSCMCSPTNHPGSFRCSLHKDRKHEAPAGSHGRSKPVSPPSPVSTGGAAKRVEGSALESGTWARRALAPSPQPQSQHRRRDAGGFHFHPRARPSRLSVVSFAGDRAGENL